MESLERRLVQARALQEAEKIESALLTQDVFAVPAAGGGHIVFRVPGWRERPVRRLRIEWYRWRRRRLIRP